MGNSEYPEGFVLPDLFDPEADHDIEGEMEEVDIGEQTDFTDEIPDDRPPDPSMPPARALAYKHIDRSGKRIAEDLAPAPVPEPSGELQLEVASLRESCLQLFYCVCTLYQAVTTIQAAHAELFEENPHETPIDGKTEEARETPKIVGIGLNFRENRIPMICLGAYMLITIVMLSIALIR